MKYLSLFSGIGGFEYGIQQSNKADMLECVGFSEIDKYARSIYLRHFPTHKDLGDVTKIKTEDLPDFDFLVGGFPCQAFSVAGQRRGFDDTRGTLFFEIARILKDKRPRYFLLENVTGLLSHQKGKTFQRILEILTSLGYDVTWQVLNSKDFGVPQRRERVFIKGYSRGRCAGEVLSVRGAYEENPSSMKCKRTPSRDGYICDDTECTSATLTVEGQNSGKSHLIPDTHRVDGNPYASQDCRVYSHNGLSVALNATANNDWYTTDDSSEELLKKNLVNSSHR